MRDTDHRLFFLPTTGCSSYPWRVKTNAEPNRTKQRTKQNQSESKRSQQNQTQHTPHTQTQTHLLLFSLEGGMDRDGVKPGLGSWTVSHTTSFLIIRWIYFVFLFGHLSYVSNKNIWKRIRTDLFDLTFWVSDSSDLYETDEWKFSDFRVSRGSRDWIGSDVACGLGFDFGSDWNGL